MSAIRGLFKNVTGDDTGANDAAPNPANNDGSKGVSGFLAGTSNFFNSVTAKKDDFMSDLTTKLGNFTPAFGEDNGANNSSNAAGKKKGGGGGYDSGDDSSASEYGDGGDKPVYADKTLKERRLSLDSVDSLPEDETKKYKEFMNEIVEEIFDSNSRSFDSKKSTFNSYCKHHTGRSNFAKTIYKKRLSHKQVNQEVMKRLTDCFNGALQPCHDNEDFKPARLMMNLCFTFYTEVVTPADGRPVQTYLYSHLKALPIWQSIRFWNAAFFEALGQERAKKPEPTTDDVEKALNQDKEFQENVAYGQLSTFTWNMVALGLSREVVLEFLRKQAAVANLPKDKGRLIRANIQKWTA